MTDNEKTVSALYEAFGRGDIPAILDMLAGDVQWESWADNFAQTSGVPWLQLRTGKDGVQAFFEIVGTFRIDEFRVLSMMSGGNQVAAEVVIDATLPTGGHYRDEEVHLWTFDVAGKIVRMRHYVDTAKHIAAARYEEAAAGGA